MTTVAEKVAEKMGKPDGMPTDVFFKNNKTAARVLSNVMAKAEAAKNKTMMMAAKGGYVSYAEGGDTETTATTTPVEPDDVPTKTPEELAKEEQDRIDAQNKTIGEKSYTAVADPTSLVTKTPVQKIDTTDTEQKIDPTTGQVSVTVPTVSPTTAQVTTATTPTEDLTPATATTTSAETKTKEALEEITVPTMEVGEKSLVEAVTKDPEKMTALGVEDVKQITSPTQVVAPNKRVIKEEELISGSAVDMAAVKEATDIEAATADPSKKATVQGQLEGLMQDFEGGATPPWAAGAMRAATAQMAARGLGSSSMAGMATVQAAMESALPIAQMDASNKQQMAMAKAEQRAKFLGMDFDQKFQTKVRNAARISEVANMNFTAEQTVALENARMANTVNIANLDARNAKVLADAATMSQLDMANLNNRQQAEVQNAQAFLEMDMANLDNEQQTSLFKAQQRVSAILSDTAAENASRQFNASSQMQTDQFMANLSTQVSQFNVEQKSSMDRFNAGEANAQSRFNAQQENARDEFNAKNHLVVAQSNAQWAQSVTTAKNAAVNQSNRDAALAANNLTMTAYNAVVQRERDMLAWAWQSADNAADRDANIMVANISANKGAAGGGFLSKAASKFLATIGAAAVDKVFLKEFT